MTSAGPVLGGKGHLLDNSVFSRTSHPDVVELYSGALEQNLLYWCGPFLLEAVYSARTADEAREISADIQGGMRPATIDAKTWQLAYSAQQTMAAVGERFHRRPPIDYLVAAAAHQHDLGILHYDHDFELIADHSGLAFVQTRVATAGTLERAGEQRPAAFSLRKSMNQRLDALRGDRGEEALYRSLIVELDALVSAAGKPALPPPDV